MNMMSNALKFTNEGQISVRLTLHDIETVENPDKKEEPIDSAKNIDKKNSEDKGDKSQLKR